MIFGRFSKISGLSPFLAAILVGCGAATPSPTPVVTPSPPAATVLATASVEPSAVSAGTSQSGGMALRFISPTDGSSAAVAFDANGRPVVTVKVEVTGTAPFAVDLFANGVPAVDEGGHQLEVRDPSGVVPFTTEILWTPPKGGGEYSLTATAIDSNKNQAEATVHVTVTGVAASTPMPPALTHDQAASLLMRLIQDTYNVRIPAPSLQRFDAPANPNRSRWIGAAYYKGMRYYAQIFDDGHVEWSNGPYADPAHRSTTGAYTYCRPAGTYKVLVVFVDYKNTGTVKQDALAKVPGVVAWLNGEYTAFAVSQGLSSAPMQITADAAYVDSPPAPGELLTREQMVTRTGKDPSKYDFTMQIDLDAQAQYSTRNFPGVMEPGGGFALEACGTGKFGAINIWSSVTTAGNVQGDLAMDFNHELSHMFGMMDDYPYTPGVAGPNGTQADDWIPYTMFGWTDTDGDGVPEIIDSTPYGTAGPKP